MAWVDDRLWCHPKMNQLSDRAFRVWVNGVAFSAGFGTRGFLSAGDQRTIGAGAKVKRELVSAGLWEQHGDSVYIHDWEQHNGKRDARRAADRERKRRGRSDGTSTGQSAGTSAGPARVEGSEGSDGTSSAVTRDVYVDVADRVAASLGSVA